ncbi:hypothetical protein IAD21_00538 [Abditibacteriota bacterium]|nr:hypothetical protein IAD21_00538 [Abditibacteriota bacterium]
MKNPIVESFVYLTGQRAFYNAQIELAQKTNQLAKVKTLERQRATTQEAIDLLISDAVDDVPQASLEKAPT